jgi:sulfur relay protein TusB/DsrH
MILLSLLESNQAALQQCLAVSGLDDALILLGDAVHLAAQVPSTQRFYVLEDDVLARGLPSAVLGSAQVIDDAAWVALCAQAQQLVRWSC